MLFADDGLGSTELSGLDFGGDATFGSATVLPEDACGASGEGPGGFGSISLAEVRRCSFTSLPGLGFVLRQEEVKLLFPAWDCSPMAQRVCLAGEGSCARFLCLGIQYSTVFIWVKFSL